MFLFKIDFLRLLSQKEKPPPQKLLRRRLKADSGYSGASGPDLQKRRHRQALHALPRSYFHKIVSGLVQSPSGLLAAEVISTSR